MPLLKVSPAQAIRMKPETGVFVNGQAKIDIRQFDGLNTRKSRKPTESPDMQNMSTDAYPLATTRSPRQTMYTGTGTPYVIFPSVKLCGVLGTSFIWDILGTPAVKFTVTLGKKSIVDFNGCVIVFPDKKYYDYISGIAGTLTCAYAIDLATVWNNRMFGVKGSDIHVSAQGNKDSWEAIVDDPTSAWHTDVASLGDFTSIRTYGSHPVLKKETITYEIYGSSNANFQVIEIVADGSLNNDCDVELLGSQYYMGSNGVMRYGGGYPELSSLQLTENYTIGVMGSDGRRLYFSAYDGTVWDLLVYDPIFDKWMREDDLQVVSFARFGGYLYALTADSKVLKFRSGTENVEWYRDTDMTDDGTLDPKETTEIVLQINAVSGTTITVSTRSDESAAYILRKSFTLAPGGRQVLRCPLPSEDSYFNQVRVAGDKAADIHWIQRVVVPKEA